MQIARFLRNKEEAGVYRDLGLLKGQIKELMCDFRPVLALDCFTWIHEPLPIQQTLSRSIDPKIQTSGVQKPDRASDRTIMHSNGSVSCNLLLSK